MKQLRRTYNFPRSEMAFHRLKRLFEMLSGSAFWLDLPSLMALTIPNAFNAIADIYGNIVSRRQNRHMS